METKKKVDSAPPVSCSLGGRLVGLVEGSAPPEVCCALVFDTVFAIPRSDKNNVSKVSQTCLEVE